jgi:hypothetical protein
MKKLPVKSRFLFAVAFFYLMTSCKEESSVDLNSTPSSDGKGIQVRLTSEEQAVLADLIRKEGVKDSIDFLNKISYVKSKSNNQKFSRSATNSTITNTNSHYAGSEEIFIATFDIIQSEEMPLPIEMGTRKYPMAPHDRFASYKNVGIQSGCFIIRGNQVVFSIPHVIKLKMRSDGFKITKAEVINIDEMPGSPPSIQPVAPFWGAYESKLPAYVQGISGHTANVYAAGTERRAEVASNQGVYNQYFLDGTFYIQLLSPPDFNGQPPRFIFVSFLKCTQYGVLSN